MMMGIAVLTILVLSTTCFADDIYTGVVTGTVVNVRDTPSVNGMVAQSAERFKDYNIIT